MSADRHAFSGKGSNINRRIRVKEGSFDDLKLTIAITHSRRNAINDIAPVRLFGIKIRTMKKSGIRQSTL